MPIHPYPRLFIMTTVPTVGDDSADGYEVGDFWIVAGIAYQALDVTVGAAIWYTDFSGWIPILGAWTRTGDFTFTTPGTDTGLYPKGAKVRYKDGGAFNYGVIASSSQLAGTITVNLIPNSDHTMAATTITDRYVSFLMYPEGIPGEFNYVPSVGGITLGNGTIVGRWQALGEVMHVHIDFVLGSTSAVTGAVSFGMPVVAAAYGGAGAIPNGIAQLLDSGTAFYAGQVYIASGAGGCNVRVFNASGTYVTLTPLSSTVPMTWGTADEINIEFSYFF